MSNIAALAYIYEPRDAGYYVQWGNVLEGDATLEKVTFEQFREYRQQMEPSLQRTHYHDAGATYLYETEAVNQ